MTESMACDWRVSWTEDGETWHGRGFCMFETAQKFARDLVEKNDRNPAFSFYAARMMTVNRKSFIDAKSADAVELAPHLLGTAETF